MRCGWGLERNRNGGNAAMAILALPSVAGKFGVRGGGYSMSNSSAWNITRPWLGPEPATRIVNMNKLGRALMELSDPPIKAMFVYNANPVATLPDQQRVLQGMARDDLFTVVFDQVMTDTAAYADVILPATTFLEAYDFAKGYGPLSLQLVRPVIDTVGESRSNPEVFGELAKRLGVLESGETDNELDMLLAGVQGAAGRCRRADRRHGPGRPAVWIAPRSVRRRHAEDVRRQSRSLSGGARSGSADRACTRTRTIRLRNGFRSRSSRRRATKPSARRWASCRGPESRL